MDRARSRAPEGKAGLEGVVAGETSISYIDGLKGRLYYRGYTIEDVAKNCTFEEASYLLIKGRLPNSKELASFSAGLVRLRNLPDHIVSMMKTFTSKMSSMEALRTSVSALSSDDPDARISSIDDKLKTGLSVIAKMPTIVAYHHRIKNGLPIIRPDPKLGHAANFIYMLTGAAPDEETAKILDTDFVLHADHGFNASTFSVRVTVSTLSDVHSAFVTGISTLKGPLHGGAAMEVITMLKRISTPKNVEKYVLARLAAHDKIMGYGHRIYRTYDPRARILKATAGRLSKQKGNTRWMEMGEQLEKIMQEQKNIYPNVDFYSAIVYHSIGMPLELSSPIFAIGRSSGWLAHMIEQYTNNRLIRPIEQYTGELNLRFVPLKKRK
ncbi:MAG: citrate synthase [Candidatus Micrarchaeota archaeon]|nr:citrate synthase [Candidatus Micrarchaeota archaeon]